MHHMFVPERPQVVIFCPNTDNPWSTGHRPTDRGRRLRWAGVEPAHPGLGAGAAGWLWRRRTSPTEVAMPPEPLETNHAPDGEDSRETNRFDTAVCLRCSLRRSLVFGRMLRRGCRPHNAQPHAGPGNRSGRFGRRVNVRRRVRARQGVASHSFRAAEERRPETAARQEAKSIATPIHGCPITQHGLRS